jgi:hypothetical protein
VNLGVGNTLHILTTSFRKKIQKFWNLQRETVTWRDQTSRRKNMPSPRQTLRNITSVKIFSFEKPIVQLVHKPIDLNIR